MVNHLAARLFGARDGLAVGIAGDFHVDFAVGNFGEGLPDDFHGLEQFIAAHGATGVAIAFSARDRFDLNILERGVTECAHVLHHATAPQCGADAAEILSFLFRKHAHTAEPCFHRAVIEKNFGDIPQLLLDHVHLFENVLDGLGVHVAPHAADFAGAENDAPAGGGFNDIEHLFAHAPRMHEQVFKAHAVGHQPQPEQMAVDAGKFAPDRPQIQRARRHLNVHDGFNGLAIGLSVDETADAANAFGDINEFDVILLFRQFLQSAMDETDGRPRFDDLFVLHDEVEMNRLRQNRMLRAEWNNGACHKNLFGCSRGWGGGCHTAGARRYVAGERELDRRFVKVAVKVQCQARPPSRRTDRGFRSRKARRSRRWD